MASSINRDEGPVYYREIQKNAYLKRIPNEPSGSKLRPLGHKKPPLKPMWTLFCVHNGRTPFLEQYPEPDSSSALTHRPTWRACLRTARHVTASVKPRTSDEHDFLIDTDHGPIRMLAPDWESMQDWVTCLRNKLHELKILRASENVYVSPPVAPPPRAGTRDPTSPLPPTPPVPPDRVPGIELTAQLTRPTTTITEQPSSVPENPETPQNTTTTMLNMENQETVENRENISETVDISNWDTSFHSLPSTSQDSQKIEPKKSVAKICGQNICLDDSILKRASNTTDSDEDFFAEIDRIHDSVENLDFREHLGENVENFSSLGGYKQRVLVNNDLGKSEPSCSVASNNCSEFPATNVTVIKVSNKGPPHTAIPVLGPETDIFDFDFKPKESTSAETSPGTEENFINIVNTEVDVQNTAENGYGTVFNENDNSDYGHLSLTTTVSLTGVSDMTADNNGVTAVSSDVTAGNDGLYERLCMASTSEASPRPVRRLKFMEKSRKSSLPNLECTDTTYEYLFPNQNNNRNMSNVTLNCTENQNRVINGTEINSNNHNILSDEVSRAMNIQVNASVGANLNSNARVLRSNVERSHSQNAYDSSPRLRDQLIRRVQNYSPKRDAKNDKTESNQAKPIWKRGLTELSLLTRLRGFGQARRQESPTRHENDNNDRNVTSPVKVVHRSRPETRVDSARRRSSSLSNGQSPPASNATPAWPSLQPLRQRQAAALRAEQRRGAAAAATIPTRDPPILCDYNRQVWVAWWSRSGSWCAGRTGDRIAALRGTPPRDAQHARQLLKTPAHTVDILFHRVPLGKIYVLNKRDHEYLGIKLDNECNITSVETQSPAGRAGLPPPGKWALTEVNNRPINLIKGGEEEMNRLAMHGSEVSILIQPSPLVKKIRAAIKANKPILAIR